VAAEERSCLEIELRVGREEGSRDRAIAGLEQELAGRRGGREGPHDVLGKQLGEFCLPVLEDVAGNAGWDRGLGALDGRQPRARRGIPAERVRPPRYTDKDADQ